MCGWAQRETGVMRRVDGKHLFRPRRIRRPRLGNFAHKLLAAACGQGSGIMRIFSACPLQKSHASTEAHAPIGKEHPVRGYGNPLAMEVLSSLQRQSFGAVDRRITLLLSKQVVSAFGEAGLAPRRFEGGLASCI